MSNLNFSNVYKICYCLPYLCLHKLGSGNTSRGGAKLSIIICLAYCRVVLKLLSVPWNLSKTPSTPKQLLNLKFPQLFIPCNIPTIITHFK